ncbi:MAG TPA: zf-HC2 domain-containing protein [Holophagaceae bacterium]|nr:zf-HC2 domain-containing protein [Holophagaceae bacterium]
MILFNCEHATDRMTDYMEGALPWRERLALRVHLLACRTCPGFLRSLRQVPVLARQAYQEPLPASAVGCSALDAVLGRIRAGEGRTPQFHPDPIQWQLLAEGRLDLPMKLLLETHLGACAACRAAHPGATPASPVPEAVQGQPPLPRRILEQLPDPKAWTWYNHLLNGARSSRLWEDPATGVGLWLTYVPSGRRFPHHEHTGQEAAVLLAGWVQDGPDLAGPGDYVQREGGSHHAPSATGQDGCWIFARVGPGGLHFRGWRRIFG